jgi:hypothetical protein
VSIPFLAIVFASSASYGILEISAHELLTNSSNVIWCLKNENTEVIVNGQILDLVDPSEYSTQTVIYVKLSYPVITCVFPKTYKNTLTTLGVNHNIKVKGILHFYPDEGNIDIKNCTLLSQ